MRTTATTSATGAFFTKRGAADYVGCTTRFLERRIADGEIAVFQPSKRLVRIRRTELERWIATFTHGRKEVAA